MYIKVQRKSVKVIEHTSKWICQIVPETNVIVPLTLQMAGAVKKHDVVIQLDSARAYTTRVTQYVFAENIINVSDGLFGQFNTLT